MPTRRVTARCIAGEVAAWEEIYAQCHTPLQTFVRRRLGPTRHDPELVDELTARVWYALVADDGKLSKRYDPQRKRGWLRFCAQSLRAW